MYETQREKELTNQFHNLNVTGLKREYMGREEETKSIFIVSYKSMKYIDMYTKPIYICKANNHPVYSPRNTTTCEMCHDKSIKPFTREVAQRLHGSSSVDNNNINVYFFESLYEADINYNMNTVIYIRIINEAKLLDESELPTWLR